MTSGFRGPALDASLHGMHGRRAPSVIKHGRRETVSIGQKSVKVKMSARPAVMME